jgi:AraC family transcriptional activator of pobA
MADTRDINGDDNRDVPTYKLFGEKEPWPTPDMVHCESIAARSRLHNWQITPHRHNGLFQVLYLAGGNALVRNDDAHCDMFGGQVMLVPQMCVHGFRFDQGAAGYVVTFAYPLIRKLAREAGDSLVALASPCILTLGDDAEGGHIKAAFQALDAEYRGNAPFRSLQVESLLSVILVWLGRRTAQPARDEHNGMSRGSEHFQNFFELIEEHYMTHKPLSWYAHRLGITAAHLNAVCRQAVGKSALELIHERMILEAKRNLVYTSMTISVVSYTIGFADPAYFTRFFKRQVGMSPKEFRQQAGTS